MKAKLAAFLSFVAEYIRAKPTYKLGGSSLTFCDCIGMVIGALKKCGIKWVGIHGSNYAARYRLTGGIHPIKAESDLKPGYLVFKGNDNPKTSALPSRYKKGGSLYNGDLTDYYHVGVVQQVNPLVIGHMTTPTTKQDKKIGAWNFYGLCCYIDYDEPAPGPEPTPTYPEATVYAPTGKTVNLRKGPGKNYGIIERVPIGDKVQIITPGLDWDRVQHGKNVGYMMTEFLRKEEA